MRTSAAPASTTSRSRARRAQNVRDYLVSRGIQGLRFRTVSYGKERPVAVCNDISCWSQNRRAVTVLDGGAGAQSKSRAGRSGPARKLLAAEGGTSAATISPWRRFCVIGTAPIEDPHGNPNMFRRLFVSFRLCPGFRRPRRRAGRRRRDRAPEPAREPGPADVRADRAAPVREPAAQGPAAQVPGGRGVPLPGGPRRLAAALLAPSATPSRPAPAQPQPAPPQPQRRSDVFDPVRGAGCARRAAAARLDAAVRAAGRPDAGPSHAAARRAARRDRRPDRGGRRRAARRSIGTPHGRTAAPVRRAPSPSAPGPSVAATSVGDPACRLRRGLCLVLRRSSTSRPRWASAASCSPIRATSWCRRPPSGSARPISSAAATARRPSSS